MRTDRNEDEAGLEAGGDEALWQLLGRRGPVEVSPYFARRVLRDLDAGAGSARGGLGGWLGRWRSGWAFAGGTAGLAVLLGVFSFLPGRQPVIGRQAIPLVSVPAAESRPVSVTNADEVGPQDVEVIADLDNLEARAETSVWTDENFRL